jgi:hypothetical protein
MSANKKEKLWFWKNIAGKRRTVLKTAAKATVKATV